MKKIFYFVVVTLLAGFGMVGCGDNEDFSSAHILTDAELKEIHRQDSLDSVRRSMIDANAVFDYAVEFYVSENSYDGTFLELRSAEIAQAFGITETELLHGIANIDGAGYPDGADIKGFAIDGSTHKDYASASNTNGTWGHWWDENGDVTSWGDNARVFLEYYDPEENEPYGFYVGQMPGKLVPDQPITILECLKYQDIRVALQITVTGKERGAITGGIVYEENLEITLTPNDAGSYEPYAFPFDEAAVLSAIGLSEISANNLLAYNADGSFAQELNADAGFWFDKSGPVGSWGDNASAWISYGVTDPGTIGVCLMPNATAAGDVYCHDFGFYNGDKIAMLHITINVSGFVDPETAPEGDPCTIETDINLKKTFSTDYANVQYDVRDILKDAFKMTTYQIFSAKNDGSLKIYIDQATDEDPAYSADAPGYWLGDDGSNVGWSNGIVWVSLGGNESNLYLYGGNHPENCNPNGQTVNTKYVVTCNGGTAIFNIKFDVVGYEDPEVKPGTTPADASMDLTMDLSMSEPWPGEDIDVSEVVKNAFNLTTYEVFQAWNNGDINVYLNEVTDGAPEYNANPGEYWINTEGTKSEVGWPDAPIYTGFYSGQDYLLVGAGVNTDTYQTETSQTVAYKLIVTYQGTQVTFNITLNLNVD